MCFFPLFASKPPKRRYSTLYSEDELPPPRKKRMTRPPEKRQLRHETLKGHGVKRTHSYFVDPSPRMAATTLPLRGQGVKRDPPRQTLDRVRIERESSKRPVVRSSHRRPSARNAPRRQNERTLSRHCNTSLSTHAPQRYAQASYVEPSFNYHSNFTYHATPSFPRDGYAIRAATNQALREVYQDASPRHLRRRPAYGALRHEEIRRQW